MFAEKCLRYNLFRVANSSPLCILNKLKINTHSLTGFANYAKQIRIQKFQDNCTIQNRYTCLSINNTNRYIFKSNLHVSETPTPHRFKHTTKYGHKYIGLHTHTYMYKYIETNNTHIMYAQKCIHSCTHIDYHI